MNEELVKETTFQSSPNFWPVYRCLTVKCTCLENMAFISMISVYLAPTTLLDTMCSLYQ